MPFASKKTAPSLPTSEKSKLRFAERRISPPSGRTKRQQQQQPAAEYPLVTAAPLTKHVISPVCCARYWYIYATTSGLSLYTAQPVREREYTTYLSGGSARLFLVCYQTAKQRQQTYRVCGGGCCRRRRRCCCRPPFFCFRVGMLLQRVRERERKGAVEVGDDRCDYCAREDARGTR